MTLSNEERLRIFYIAQMLEKYTDEDENHTLSTVQILEKLKTDHGIKAHRTTIPTDIQTLNMAGMEIESIRKSQNRYHIVSRKFETPELKLLIDAIQSSCFITEKKSEELIKKMLTFTSEPKAQEIKRNLLTYDRFKPSNEYIYYIVDTINDAINRKKKISFKYFKYNEHKAKVLLHDGGEYLFSPYHLVWDGDRYYVVGYCHSHNKIGSYRVDRIYTSPQILEDSDIYPVPLDFDIAEYMRTMMHMYSSERAIVKMNCDNDTMNSIIDRFGESVETEIVDDNTFNITVEIAVNHVFFGWVFGFNGKVRIISPSTVMTQYCDMLKNSISVAESQVCEETVIEEQETDEEITEQ